MKLVIWTRTLDHLQLHTWTAVQALVAHPITYVLTEPENHGRRRQGWQAVDLGGLDVIPMKARGWWRQSSDILEQHADAVHVFWGFWSERRLFPLIVRAAQRGIRTAVINEHYAVSPVGYMKDEPLLLAGSKVALRPLVYRLAASLLSRVSNRGKQVCIFPISSQAREQYLRAGFDGNTFFPFGYFVQKLALSGRRERDMAALRLIFVGALLKRKGLDVAVEALQKLDQGSRPVTLDVYGSGDPSAFLSREVTAVRYQGVIPTEQAQSVIAQYDALLLPSRHDGWGVVVNEALLQGVPAIVSDHVGAKCLLEAGGAGLIFESGNAHDLAEKLTMLRDNPALLGQLQNNARRIGREILPETGARYFIDALTYYFYGIGSRPTAVWHREG